MGAVFHCERFEGKLTHDELQRRYKNRRQELEVEYGTGAYNGTFSTLDGRLVIHSETLNSEKEAAEFLDQRAEKWGAAHAVKFRDVQTENAVEPTFRGKKAHELGYGGRILVPALPEQPHYYLKSVAQAPKSGTYEYEFVAAEQLKPAIQEKLLAATPALFNMNKQYTGVQMNLERICLRMPRVASEISTEDFSSVKKLRKQMEKLWKATHRLAVQVHALDEKHGAKLYETRDVDHGEFWLIGGLCAE
jgi:hypothetical protein